MNAYGHPPKPRLALNVAVIGHRPNRLPAAQRDAVARETASLLKRLAEAARAARTRHQAMLANEPPVLRLISSLAEGADRIAAEASLELGYSLLCVLPFAADDYSADFADNESRAKFSALLERGEALVLPGERSAETRAYELAGRTAIDAADVVLTLWDGDASAGRGGTTELLNYAARQGLPIVHVDARGVAATRLLWEGFAPAAMKDPDVADLPEAGVEVCEEVIDRLVGPPTSSTEAAPLEWFLSEKHEPRNYRIEVPALLALLGLRAMRKSDLIPAGPARLTADFSAEHCGDERLGTLAEAYGWADALGNRYAQIFRSAYSVNFLLAALAVSMAVLPLVLAGPKWPFVLVELGFVALIIINTVWGRKRHYHDRWLESREVAERLRAGLLPWLLGRRAAVRAVASRTWTGWYTSAHFRALGLRLGSMDAERCRTTAATIAGVIESQRRYHVATAERMHRTEHRLERIGEVCFAATAIVALSYLVGAMVGWDAPSWWGYTVSALTAGLPAFGSATFGVRLIGDFHGTAARCARTSATLDSIGQALKSADTLPALSSLADAASTAMVGDLSHWRLSRETRPLALPG